MVRLLCSTNPNSLRNMINMPEANMTALPDDVANSLIAHNKSVIAMIDKISEEDLLQCLLMINITAFREGELLGINKVREMIK